MKMYRQGDVLIVQVRGVPKKAVPEAPRGGRLVLAEGEATGHAHAIELPAVSEKDRAAVAALFRTENDRLYLKAGEGVDVVHQEHDTIALPKGTYEVRRQREYSPEEIRRVAD